MALETVSIIVFLLCVLGIIIIILRRLPDAVKLKQEVKETNAEVLQKKGLPALETSWIKKSLGFWHKRLWNFLLEAKDLRPKSNVGYRMKQFLRRKKAMQEEKAAVIIPPPPIEAPLQSLKDEAYFLDKIKEEPKNLDNYVGLGSYYLDNKSYIEAKDVYSYLVGHMPGDAGVLAKLAYTQFHLKEYKPAVENYEKSLALDSTQPNRYYNLGLCYEAGGELKKAIDSLQKALDLEPDSPKYQDTLNRMKLKTEV